MSRQSSTRYSDPDLSSIDDNVSQILSLLSNMPSLSQASQANQPNDQILGRVYQEIALIRNELQDLNKQVAKNSSIMDQVLAMVKESSNPTCHITTNIAPPPVFTGNPEDCQPFLSHCEMVFKSNPATYESTASRVRFAMSFMSGNPKKFFLDYVPTVDKAREERSLPVRSFENFSAALTNAFGFAHSAVWAETKLRSLKQTGRAADYTVDFKTFGPMTGWNSAALCSQYIMGLNEPIKAKLAEEERIQDFEKLIAKVHQIDTIQRLNVDLENAQDPPLLG